MAQLSTYQQKYPNFALDRADGVLHLRFHTNGGAFVWCGDAHRLLVEVLHDIDSDTENRVLLLSGTGIDFLGTIDLPSFKGIPWEILTWEGKRCINSLLSLEIPVVAAVRGKCTIHAEIALLSDVVLATADAVFGDAAHLPRNVVPGDGSHVLWTALLGHNRGRYMLFSEEIMNAEQAYHFGVIGEIVATEKLLARAFEHARRIAAKPAVVARNTRTALIRPLKAAFDDALTVGLALQGAAYGNRPHRGEVPVEPD